MAIMSWQNVTRSSLCSGVKECGTKLAHNFLFPKSSFRIRRTKIFRMSKDSAFILDAIQPSFLTKSATAAMFTSVRVDFGRLPLSSSSTSSLPSRKGEHHLKRLVGSEPHAHKLFAPILVFLSQIDRLWNKVLWQLCSFRSSVTCKENWLYKTSYNSYTVEDKGNSVCERMLVDST